MLAREEWLTLARKLDRNYSYVREEEVFPEVSSGRPWLPHSEWDWEVSFKTSYREYVENQYEGCLCCARRRRLHREYPDVGCALDEVSRYTQP